MQKVKTLMAPIESEDLGIPLVLRVKGKKTAGIMEGGVASVQERQEVYVCVSQLPPELQERIRTAVQNLLRP